MMTVINDRRWYVFNAFSRADFLYEVFLVSFSTVLEPDTS